MTDKSPKFRPMLAGTISTEYYAAEIDKYVMQPKYDGIRCIIHPNLGPVTRQLKPIPNPMIRAKLSSDKKLIGLDGELVMRAKPSENPTEKHSFCDATSFVMSKKSFDIEMMDFLEYRVFDDITNPEDQYQNRIITAYHKVIDTKSHNLPFIHVVEPYLYIFSMNDINKFEERMINAGFEGIILRHCEAKYKFGRSGRTDPHMIKIKQFLDAEATIIGFEELFHNENTSRANNLGYAQKQSLSENLTPAGILGALICSCPVFPNETFKIGTGFNITQREEIWNNREKYLGLSAKFKYQPQGGYTKPRTPVFVGIRLD